MVFLPINWAEGAKRDFILQIPAIGQDNDVVSVARIQLITSRLEEVKWVSFNKQDLQMKSMISFNNPNNPDSIRTHAKSNLSPHK